MIETKKTKSYATKINWIKQFFKKNDLFLEINLENYESYHIYIRIDYIKKSKSYKLSWFDLDLIESNNINKFISSQYLSNETIEYLKTIFEKIDATKTDFFDKLTLEGKVSIYANTQTKNTNDFSATFYKFIPKSLAQLSEVFITIFNNLPRKLENFLFELHAELTDSKMKYEYKNKFNFDLFNDDLEKIFNYSIAARGKDYYENDMIQFLEKIDDRYFAIVEGSEKYLVIIKYDEENKEVQFYCSCPCEFYCKHIYAVILSIRNNEFNRFYKVIYKNPKKSLIEIFIDFDYYLCLGTVEENLEIVNNYGKVELVPIFDINGKNNWTVLEDTEDQKLAREIQNVVRGNSKYY